MMKQMHRSSQHLATQYQAMLRNADEAAKQIAKAINERKSRLDELDAAVLLKTAEVDALGDAAFGISEAARFRDRAAGGGPGPDVAGPPAPGPAGGP